MVTSSENTTDFFLKREQTKEKSDDHHASSSHDYRGAAESHSAFDKTKGDINACILSKKSSPVEDGNEGIAEDESCFTSFRDLLTRIEDMNLAAQCPAMHELQKRVSILQEENQKLKEEIKELNELNISLKFIHSSVDTDYRFRLEKKIETLEASLRVEIFKANEYRRELNDSRQALMRRTRSRVKKHQPFEIVIAQKPQDVPLASCAGSLEQTPTIVESCPICLEVFDGASGWYSLNCNHKYHLMCLAQVMPVRSRCCICNQELHKILYEVFGMANKYPDDARLWDAQTGQPVDFTLEEDIRALTDAIQGSQSVGEANEEDSDVSSANEQASTLTIHSRENYSAQSVNDTESSWLVEDSSQDVEEENESSSQGIEEDDETESADTTDTDTEEIEEEEESTSNADESILDTEEGDDAASSLDVDDGRNTSDDEESSTTSVDEEDDPNDPDYLPSQ
ncbi:hypothetical protein KP509_23G055100 [Ceratopteris richardii]|uniref:RING-type domain-containing protein n=1 Tax=Ceratopteris richardii TaxID=49495 RepID=A0A8T2RZZ7_CERRI|nr:hypothetical protein KP509_23G055100 [Ceratopteris richardii]